MALDIIPLNDSFAVQIKGVDLWEKPSAATIEQIHDLWTRHGLLVFRRQAISEAELLRFSRLFGEVVAHTRPDWSARSNREITLISNMKNAAGDAIGGLGAGEITWHTDQSFVPYPATGCLLYAVELPLDNPGTSWANLSLAYASLSHHLKRRVEGKVAIFDYAKRVGGYERGNEPSAEIAARLPPVKHSLVNRHPLTGEKSLYLDPGTMSGVNGMEDSQGVELLDALTQAAIRPEFVYHHHWQIGDVVMWDNACLLHRRDAFQSTGNRLLKRTIIRLSPERYICPQPG